MHDQMRCLRSVCTMCVSYRQLWVSFRHSNPRYAMLVTSGPQPSSNCQVWQYTGHCFKLLPGTYLTHPFLLFQSHVDISLFPSELHPPYTRSQHYHPVPSIGPVTRFCFWKSLRLELSACAISRPSGHTLFHLSAVWPGAQASFCGFRLDFKRV